jgi:phosphate transport system protein
MWEKLKNIWKSDNLLDEAWKQSFEMLEICNEMFLEAVHVLRETHENKVDEKIRAKDKIVNKYERNVRKNVITHLAVQSPIDLAQGMVLVSIVIDIERLGDYTKNIIGLASMHPEILKGGKLEENLKKIENAVKDQFINTNLCIGKNDQNLAIEILVNNKWVNPLCDTCIESLVKAKDKQITAGQSASLALYIRWLKRINSHLRNITTSVVNPFHRIGFDPKK